MLADAAAGKLAKPSFAAKHKVWRDDARRP